MRVAGRPAPGAPEPASAAPPGVAVRPGRPSDARGVLDLIRGVAAEGRYIRTERVDWSVGDTRRRLRRAWTPNEGQVVAVAGRRVIGHLAVAREEGAATRHVASLGMAVAAGWRGRGVGSALLAEAFRWGRWAGVEKMVLSVYPDNEAALALYRKFGFVEEGRLTGHSKKSSGYRDEILMARWL